MAKINYDESTAVVGFKQGVFVKYGFEIDEDIAKGYTKSLFTAIDEFLKIVKSESEAVAFEVTSVKGEFIFGAVVRYEKNEDVTMPGNWEVAYTFNEEDLADVSARYRYTDPQFGVILSNTMFNLFNYVWNVDTATGNHMTIGAFDAIKSFLDTNAVEGDIVELTCGDLFVATAGVENGEKVISITPGEKAKQIIKEPKA